MNIPVKFVDQTEKIETRVEDFVPIYGKSAYQIALDNGFVGTEEEWLDSLHGEDGEDGYTPQKGTDYFTEADIAEVAQQAAEFVDIEVDSELSGTSSNPIENKTIYAKFEKKADKKNPVFTGSFSQNRKANTAVGSFSHAEGGDAIASGQYSHAEGYKTKASGQTTHAEGSGTEASGRWSHAEGNGTIASGDYQHAQGKYNIADAAFAHIVGNGDDANKRSNAHTLDWDGNAWFAGEVYVGYTSGTNKDEGSKKLVTADEVTVMIESAMLVDETEVV